MLRAARAQANFVGLREWSGRELLIDNIFAAADLQRTFGRCQIAEAIMRNKRNKSGSKS